jgi:hypothetical protein
MADIKYALKLVIQGVLVPKTIVLPAQGVPGWGVDAAFSHYN